MSDLLLKGQITNWCGARQKRTPLQEIEENRKTINEINEEIRRI